MIVLKFKKPWQKACLEIIVIIKVLKNSGDLKKKLIDVKNGSKYIDKKGNPIHNDI